MAVEDVEQGEEIFQPAVNVTGDFFCPGHSNKTFWYFPSLNSCSGAPGYLERKSVVRSPSEPEAMSEKADSSQGQHG